jgi:hypothetical protein
MEPKIPEHLSPFPQEDKVGIGRDCSALQIYRNGPVKIPLDYFLLAFAPIEHFCPRFAHYGFLYQIVDHNST